MSQILILTFSDHFSDLDLTDYEEVSLMEHIKACDKIYESVNAVTFNLTHRSLQFDDRPLSPPTTTSVLAHCSQSLQSLQSHQSLQSQQSLPSLHSPESKEEFMKLSPSVLDIVHCTCDDSARVAFLRSVHILQAAKSYLLEDMFREEVDGWLGGILCRALIHTLETWACTVQVIMPRKFVRVTFVEISRLLVTMYMQRLFFLHKHRKEVVLAMTEKGVTQLGRDWRLIHTWINEHTQVDECLAEKALCRTLYEGFLVCLESDALRVFAEAVRVFGTNYEQALYDLFRMMLKFRHNITNKNRKVILSLCNEFLLQLHNATQTDPQLVQGEIPQTDILDALFPHVGTDHCTGTRWKVEKLIDPVTSRLTITMIVTETINDALETRRTRQVQLNAQSSVSSSNCNNDHNHNYHNNFHNHNSKQVEVEVVGDHSTAEDSFSSSSEQNNQQPDGESTEWVPVAVAVPVPVNKPRPPPPPTTPPPASARRSVAVGVAVHATQSPAALTAPPLSVPTAPNIAVNTVSTDHIADVSIVSSVHTSDSTTDSTAIPTANLTATTTATADNSTATTANPTSTVTDTTSDNTTVTPNSTADSTADSTTDNTTATTSNTVVQVETIPTTTGTSSPLSPGLASSPSPSPSPPPFMQSQPQPARCPPPKPQRRGSTTPAAVAVAIVPPKDVCLSSMADNDHSNNSDDQPPSAVLRTDQEAIAALLRSAKQKLEIQ
jgi:hypothetical protein